MPTPMQLGAVPIKQEFIRALWPSIVILLAAVVLTVCTRRSGWLSVGGALVSALGARLWAHRLFRVGPAAADNPLPPVSHPLEPGARAVALNSEYFNQAFQQALDNYRGYWGVWLSITGGMISSAGPFVAQSLWGIQ